MTLVKKTSFNISAEIHALLDRLAKQDRRSKTAEFEWLVEQEHARRTQPARQLVDEGVAYQVTPEQEATP